MDKQKEIERMKRIICSAKETPCSNCPFRFNGKCAAEKDAELLFNAGYRLCGGDNCPNYKHYQAECERCTKKMEIKKALEIDAIKQQAVREFAEKVKYESAMTFVKQEHIAVCEILDELVKEVCGE